MRCIVLSCFLAACAMLLSVLPAAAEIPGTIKPEDMAELIMMTRQEVLLKFGGGYVSLAPWDDGKWQRYYYPELGYTFVFEAAAGDDTPLRCIEVDDGISFDGFYGGMDWREVAERTGDLILTEKGNPSLGGDPAFLRRAYSYEYPADGGIYSLPCEVNIYGEWEPEDTSHREWKPEDIPSGRTHLRLISPALLSPSMFYNPQGGQYYHCSDYCNAVSSRFLPLTAITCYNEKITDGLTACPYCIGKEDWVIGTRYYSGSDGLGAKALVQKVYDRFTKIIVHAPEDSAVDGWRLYIKNEQRATARKVADGLYTGWFIGDGATEPARLVPVDERGVEDIGHTMTLERGR